MYSQHNTKDQAIAKMEECKAKGMPCRLIELDKDKVQPGEAHFMVRREES